MYVDRSAIHKVYLALNRATYKRCKDDSWGYVLADRDWDATMIELRTMLDADDPLPAVAEPGPTIYLCEGCDKESPGRLTDAWWRTDGRLLCAACWQGIPSNA
jgi:hypothetical protein